MIKLNDYDKEFYSKIRDFLPPRFIDIHTHIWLESLKNPSIQLHAAMASWPSRVAKDNSIEDLMQTYKVLFPDKEVIPLVFSSAEQGDDIDQLNNYTAKAATQVGCPALIFASPTWSAEELKRKIQANGFLGAKVYLSLSPAYIPPNEIRIFDFIPPHQLDVLNSLGVILMLHIPRSGRLKDPVNLAQMLEIESRYPNIKLIIAHVGRAYCNEDIGNAFDVLKKTKKMFFDFSANTNQYVFERLIDTVGPKRILFGSDMPILRMRARRITENGIYINLVPKGLYGDVPSDKNMQEVIGEEANKITFFIYEEIEAFRLAAENKKLSKSDINDIFYNNADRIIKNTRKQP
jgi:predicted TIM-barrel fold metal-dependent hydrolase